MGKQGSKYRAKRSKARNGKIQALWEYIRRNKMFRLGDALMITGLTAQTLNNYLWYLNNTGYIRLITKPKPINDRHYVLVKNTGLHAPTANKNLLYDYNTKEELRVPPSREILEIELLQTLTKSQMSRQCIHRNIKTTSSSNSVRVAIFSLVEQNIIKRIHPPLRDKVNEEMLYEIDIEKVSELLEEKKSIIYKPRSKDV